MKWYLKVLKQYAVFKGRARRKEYWMFVLINFIIGLVLGLVGPSGGDSANGQSLLLSVYTLALLIPSIAVGVRRLHDIGRTGWWMLISLIPFIGILILIIFFVQDSEPKENQYGPNPKLA